MTLITRVSRLFRADLHAVLDRIEEPDLVLRQAVREMEEDIGLDRRRLRLLHEERRRLAARSDEIARALASIGDELDACFAAGKGDLARVMIRRRLEAERLQSLLARKREETEDALRRLEMRVGDKESRLEAMRQKAELLAPADPGHAEDGWDMPPVTVREEDVEVAFLREQQRRAPK